VRRQDRLVLGRTQPVEQADEERLVDAAPHDAAWCPVGGKSGFRHCGGVLRIGRRVDDPDRMQ
jgi:hypothetical protein